MGAECCEVVPVGAGYCEAVPVVAGYCEAVPAVVRYCKAEPVGEVQTVLDSTTTQRGWAETGGPLKLIASEAQTMIAWAPRRVTFDMWKEHSQTSC